MRLEVEITKTRFFLILLSIAIVGSLVGVIAYNSGKDPSVLGHSAEELEIEINGESYNLQDAFDSNLIGGINYGDCVETARDDYTKLSSAYCPDNYVLVGVNATGEGNRLAYINGFCCRVG